MHGELIVWGDADYGNHKSEAHTFLKPIHFSYRVQLHPQEANILGNEIKKVLTNKKWSIRESDNLIEREYIANNLEEVALYIIGAVLYFSSRDDEAIEFIQKVIDKYSYKQNASFDDKVAFFNIKILLLGIYRRKINELELWPNSRKRSEEIAKARVIITELDRNKFLQNARLLESAVDFAEGGNRAKDLALEAYKINKNDSGPCFSLSFICFHDGNLVEGWKWLSLAISHKVTPHLRFGTLSMARWYEETLINRKEEYYLHFPLGVLYYLMRNYDPAKESLTIFIDKYRNADLRIYRPLLYKSVTLIRKIEKNKQKTIKNSI